MQIRGTTLSERRVDDGHCSSTSPMSADDNECHPSTCEIKGGDAERKCDFVYQCTSSCPRRNYLRYSLFPLLVSSAWSTY